jgi:hypothetical protein
VNECAGGETYDHDRDHNRIAAQRGRVWELMSDGNWRTLEEIAHETGDPEASISARLRDFRKVKFGAHRIERSYVGNGLWHYRVAARVAA